jgi:hypothetical protein
VRAIRHRALGCCAALALTVLLSACGSAKHPYDATAENNGYYVKLGGISYQLQVSRELNQYSVEDHQYLVGLPPGSGPSANEIWYGVFLWAINDSHTTATTANSFKIVDTEGHTYSPVALNPAVNQWGWTAQSLDHLQTEPGPASTASTGPTQGGLVLFKLPTSVYANRPLTLQIYAPGQSRPATISLDL